MGSRYYDQCGNCVSFKDKRYGNNSQYDQSYYEQGYCEKYRTFYYPDDSCPYQSNIGYYIATEICRILGMEDENEILKAMEELRNKFMIKKDEFAQLLMEYDVKGPIIASILRDDYESSKDKSLATALYTKHLLPTAELVSEGKYEEAIGTYKYMFDMLKTEYSLTDEIARPRTIGNNINQRVYTLVKPQK